MRIILPNGLAIDGTMEQVSQAAKILGYSIVDNRIYHYSSTKGQWVKIVDMDTKYLENALLKLLRESDDTKIIRDSHFLALLNEYIEREHE